MLIYMLFLLKTTHFATDNLDQRSSEYSQGNYWS